MNVYRAMLKILQISQTVCILKYTNEYQYIKLCGRHSFKTQFSIFMLKSTVFCMRKIMFSIENDINSAIGLCSRLHKSIRVSNVSKWLEMSFQFYYKLSLYVH